MTQAKQTIDRQTAYELLPWLLNGSLDVEERAAILEYLDHEQGAEEFAATAEIWQITGQHLPTMALAEYALGLESSEISRQRIEGHLAICSSCRGELAMIQSDGMLAEPPEDSFQVANEPLAPAASVGDFAAARLRRAPPVWRRFAVAAGLAATLAGGALISQHLQTSPAATSTSATSTSATSTSATSTSKKTVVASRAAESANTPAVSEASLAPVTSSASDLFIDGFESGDTRTWSATGSSGSSS